MKLGLKPKVVLHARSREIPAQQGGGAALETGPISED